MKTAAIYARYSSDSQSEQSIEGQLRVCEEYAQKNNILILNTYIDRAMTGTNDNRPDFQRMIQDSAGHPWDFILVYKLDRFSRNKYESTIHKRTLKNNGVKLLSAMENIPDTPEGIILESLLEGMNQYYSAELSQKVRRGMNETRLKGYFTGGHLNYGYALDERKIVVNESQANIIRFIYEQFANGVYVKDIIRALTEKGLYYKGKPFARTTVYNILRNEKYSGVYKHNGEIFENMYPQIVPQETYAIVRKKIDQNRYGKRSVQVVYHLRNKLKCGCCGMPMGAETGTSSCGKVVHYYKCSGRKRRNGCTKEMIRKEYLEEVVINEIVGKLSQQKYMNDVVQGILTMQKAQAQGTPILSMLAKEKRQTDNAIQNVMTAIERGVITNTTTKRLKELEAQQESLERQILIERSKIAVQITERDIREFYLETLHAEPQLLINQLIKEVVLFDDRIQIHFNSPLRTSPDESQGFCFYKGIADERHKKRNKSAKLYNQMRVEMYI